MTRVALVTPNFDNNSLGRTWCLWALTRSLGWRTTVVGVKGDRVWSPLAGTPFAADCVPASLRSVGTALDAADLVIAVKPLPTSFGVALEHAGGAPLLLDIDDPDLEVRIEGRDLRGRIREPFFGARQRSLRRLRRLVPTVPRLVSNPVLQRLHGGDVVPHVREAGAASGWSDSTAPVVRFVGSPRAHKGVEVLRAAVAPLAARGVTLEVTGDAPADARAWERWHGSTGVATGARLVAGADVIAVPSLPAGWSSAQLPAKLIDAMIAGRAIVASATEPIVWALDGTGLTVPPGDREALTRAIDRLRDPALRRELGAAARRRALNTFTVDAVAPRFEGAARAAMAARAVPA